MATIVQQVEALTAAYRQQITAYRQILGMAQQERSFLETGHLTELVESLRKKQTLLADMDDSALAEKRAVLAAHFRTADFSIPQMLRRALPHEREALVRLQETLAELVDVLEKLETIEKENESVLRRYSQGLSGVTSKQIQAKRAVKAYERARQASPENPQGEKSGNDS